MFGTADPFPWPLSVLAIAQSMNVILVPPSRLAGLTATLTLTEVARSFGIKTIIPGGWARENGNCSKQAGSSLHRLPQAIADGKFTRPMLRFMPCPLAVAEQPKAPRERLTDGQAPSETVTATGPLRCYPCVSQ